MQQIGRYRIVDELGRGAMGVVYRALDPAIGRTIAIKTIRLTDLTDEAERERLRDRLFREAQTAGILSHPNIVTIYDILEDGGLAYIFMEFVNGPPLERLLGPDHAPDKNTLFSILRQTAAALDYAHKKGIVHRDIKPGNIMIHEDGTAKITDFGVAKILSQQMTQTGMMMGTPSYMSPEQVQGTEVTGRADQFSLAVIGFEMLAGEKPFVADNLASLLYRICREAPMSAHRLNVTLDPSVDEVLGRALAKEPDRRFETCGELVLALERACNARPDWVPMARGSSLSMLTVNQAESRISAHESETVAAVPSARVFDSGETVALPGHVDASSYSGASARVEDSESHLVRNVVLVAAPVILAAAAFLAYRNYTPPLETTPNSQNQPDSVQPPVEKPAPAVHNEPPSAPTPSSASGTSPEIPSPAVGSDSGASSAGATPLPPRSQTAAKPETTVTMPEKTPAGVDIITRFIASPAGTRVRVDNRNDLACVTPCSLPLEVGRHTLVASAEGYRDLPRIVNLPSDASVNLELERAFGTLNIVSSPPGAAILINGQARPERTPAALKLAPGTYRLQVVSGSVKTDEETVNIRDGVVAQRKYTVE